MSPGAGPSKADFPDTANISPQSFEVQASNVASKRNLPLDQQSSSSIDQIQKSDQNVNQDVLDLEQQNVENNEQSSQVEVPPEGRSEEEEALLTGWRRKGNSKSLGDVNGTVSVPAQSAAWYRQWFAFVGVGFMVSVG